MLRRGEPQTTMAGVSDRPDPRPAGRDVLLLATCLCDAFGDDVARAAVEVLEAAGCAVTFREAQTCCGQPPFNAGDWGAARAVFAHTLEVFEDGAAGRPVVTPSASCAAMLRHGSRLLFEGRPEAEAAQGLADRTWELSDFLVHGLGATRWPGRYARQVVLHESCHGRGTGTPRATRTLLSSIRDLELSVPAAPEQCCGFGGAFSVSFPAVSGQVGRDKRDALADTGAEEVVASDIGCLLHLEHLRWAEDTLSFRHVAQVLRDALDAEVA